MKNYYCNLKFVNSEGHYTRSVLLSANNADEAVFTAELIAKRDTCDFCYEKTVAELDTDGKLIANPKDSYIVM